LQVSFGVIELTLFLLNLLFVSLTLANFFLLKADLGLKVVDLVVEVSDFSL